MVEAGSNVGSIRDKLTINLGSPDQIWQKNIYKNKTKKEKAEKQFESAQFVKASWGNKMEYEMKSGGLSKALKWVKLHKNYQKHFGIFVFSNKETR